MTQDDIRGANVAPKIPLIDPTANVIELVKAAILRQDDLRVADAKLEEERIRRLDELRDLQDKCAHEIAQVHLAGNRELANAETKRIDALLLAARADVALASEKAAAQAATLATQVATSAETLRGQVSNLANQVTTQTALMREALEKRLTLLEQSQYSIGGRDIGAASAAADSSRSSAALVAVVGVVMTMIGGAIFIAIALAK